MDQNLTMIKGDTLSFGVEIDGIDELDSAFFSVKRDRDADEYVFQKTLYDGIWRASSGDDHCIYGVRVAPEDTANIDVRDYYYDLQIRKNGDVFTVLRGVLSIEFDVTKDEPFIPAGKEPNDVIFIDYDGEIVYSYSASDFADLEKMPPNPSHHGLTAQGWNWSLTDAKAYVATYGGLVIGQNYITDDGKTRLYITISDDVRMTFPINFKQTEENGVRVDWGDGTVETFAGTGDKSVFHTYENAGDYVISLEKVSGTLTLGLGSSAGALVSGGNYNIVYRAMLNKVEIGKASLSTNVFYDHRGIRTVSIPSGLTFGQNTFHSCIMLEAAVIPANVSSLSSSTLYGCYSLKYASLPHSITSMGASSVSSNQNLARLSIPDLLTAFSSSNFGSCHAIPKFTVPASVGSIGVSAFANCYGVKVYDFSHHSSIPTLSDVNVFSNIPSDCEIRVPASLEDSWKAATNWSDYASHIVGV